jgi:hypothetical protein
LLPNSLFADFIAALIIASISAAASACIPGIRWEQRSSVTPMIERPRRSLELRGALRE